MSQHVETCVDLFIFTVMTIKIIVQSLNNKTVDVINATDFSKTTILSNTEHEFAYSNLILNIHSNLNSFTLPNFWANLSNIQQDLIVVALLGISITIVFTVAAFIKLQRK
jgi:hypothetical protein